MFLNSIKEFNKLTDLMNHKCEQCEKILEYEAYTIGENEKYQFIYNKPNKYIYIRCAPIISEFIPYETLNLNEDFCPLLEALFSSKPYDFYYDCWSKLTKSPIPKNNVDCIWKLYLSLWYISEFNIDYSVKLSKRKCLESLLEKCSQSKNLLALYTDDIQKDPTKPNYYDEKMAEKDSINYEYLINLFN